MAQVYLQPESSVVTPSAGIPGLRPTAAFKMSGSTAPVGMDVAPALEPAIQSTKAAG